MTLLLGAARSIVDRLWSQSRRVTSRRAVGLVTAVLMTLGGPVGSLAGRCCGQPRAAAAHPCCQASHEDASPASRPRAIGLPGQPAAPCCVVRGHAVPEPVTASRVPETSGSLQAPGAPLPASPLWDRALLGTSLPASSAPPPGERLHAFRSILRI